MNATTYGWIVLGSPLVGHAAARARLQAPARPHRGLARQRGDRHLVPGRRRDAVRAAPTARRSRARWWARRSPTSTSPGVKADLSILVDPLAVVMCLVVSGVSFLIHLYSVAYMDSDRGYVRFFAYLNFFVFSMLLLVLAANFVLLIVGWAFVGAASYLLISLLVPARHRHGGRHQGVRDQRDRRRGPGDRRVPAVRRHRRAGLRGRVQRRAPRRSGATTASSWRPA